MDKLSVERRSQLMARIRSKDTKPELAVRSALHKLGYRYVLHRKNLPGTPDLTFPSKNKIVFVHGCYWHGHTCKQGMAQSKSNVEFWTSKIEANRKRDRRNIRCLRAAGWKVAVVWECQIKRGNWLSRIVRFLNS